MGSFVEEKKAGVPAYMVSFGDMMTNLLTFFILLVALSTEQNAGLLARGIGSFIAVMETHGRPDVLSENRRQEIFDHVRRRFNLPPEADPDRRTSYVLATNLELLRSDVLETLAPHDELVQFAIAAFEEGSERLRVENQKYLDRIAQTLQPAPGQILVLEGHADDTSGRFGGDRRRLAFARAEAVRTYLIDEHGFESERVESRAWLSELSEISGAPARSVDARLITPEGGD
jgi:chemotaxis protein MotB